MDWLHMTAFETLLALATLGLMSVGVFAVYRAIIYRLVRSDWEAGQHPVDQADVEFGTPPMAHAPARRDG